MLGTISGGTWDTAMRPSYPPDVDLSLIMDFGVDLRTIMHIQEVQQVIIDWEGLPKDDLFLIFTALKLSIDSQVLTKFVS